jgi:Protein of unknown function (DUF3987)
MVSVSPRVVPFAPVSNEMFLKAVFGDRWGEALVAYFAGDPNPATNGQVNFQTYPAGSVINVMNHHLNNYWDVSLPRPGGGRGGQDFEAIYAIVIDDYGVKVDADLVGKLLGCDPSYIIETSPGNYHAGWFIEPQSDRAWVWGALRALYRALGNNGDNLVKPTTVVRLPVGTNGKTHLGPRGWLVKLVHWQPDVRIKTTDWIDIEARLGSIIPIDPRLDPDTAMPDPAEIENDQILQVLRDQGMVLDQGKSMTFGWGYEIECPWAADHTDPRTSAAYVPVKQRFKCHHGHCQERHVGDLKIWVDSWLILDGDSLARRDFEDYTAPATFPTGGAIDLWDEKTPPAWPGGILPGPLEDILAELARRDGLDLGALGATMITAASGAADKRSLLRPYAGSQWAVLPVLWLMLIAEPGQRKTAVLAYLLGRLRRLNAEHMQQHVREMAQWRLLLPTQRQQQPAPTVRALLAEDTTIEKLQEWMAGNPRGMLYLRDELASLFEFGRYSNGAGAAERANFLEFYEGGPTTIGRMTRTTTIDNCALSIIGGIQPHRLADFKGLADDGLLPRFGTLVMQPANGGLRNDIPMDLAPINDTIDRLLALGPDHYRTDSNGEALIRDLEQDAGRLSQRPDIGIGYRGFLRKLHGTHARVALVLHLIDGGQDQVITLNTVTRAGIYAEFLLDHAEVFYAGLAGSSENTARAIGSYILRHQLERVTAGRLRSDVAPCRALRTLKEIQDAVFLLIIGGWLQPETNHPSNHAWRVRPGLGDQFAERRRSETVRAEAIKQAMNQRGRYR